MGLCGGGRLARPIRPRICTHERGLTDPRKSAQSAACFSLLEVGGVEMQFQVKGQEYFLEYIDEEHRWFVFTQSGDGLQRIPVYVDSKKQDRAARKYKGTPKLS
jgi:hypothetical protein